MTINRDLKLLGIDTQSILETFITCHYTTNKHYLHINWKTPLMSTFNGYMYYLCLVLYVTTVTKQKDLGAFQFWLEIYFNKT